MVENCHYRHDIAVLKKPSTTSFQCQHDRTADVILKKKKNCMFQAVTSQDKAKFYLIAYTLVIVVTIFSTLVTQGQFTSVLL